MDKMLQSKDRVTEWIRKHDPHICCLQETHLRTKDLHRLKVKDWKKIFQANGQKKKKAGIAILIYLYQTNRFQNKVHKKRQRRSFQFLKGKNPPGSYKHCKHIGTQHRSTQRYKENIGGL